MVVGHGDDLLSFLVFVARVANAIAPFLATVLVPSPWRIRISSCCSTARCRVVALVTAVDHPQGPPATPALHALSADHLATQHVRVDGLGDAGPVLDPQAKAAYKRRLDALQG
jgi:hypothetical protein